MSSTKTRTVTKTITNEENSCSDYIQLDCPINPIHISNNSIIDYTTTFFANGSFAILWKETNDDTTALYVSSYQSNYDPLIPKQKIVEHPFISTIHIRNISDTFITAWSYLPYYGASWEINVTNIFKTENTLQLQSSKSRVCKFDIVTYENTVIIGYFGKTSTLNIEKYDYKLLKKEHSLYKKELANISDSKLNYIIIKSNDLDSYTVAINYNYYTTLVRSFSLDTGTEIGVKYDIPNSDQLVTMAVSNNLILLGFLQNSFLKNCVDIVGYQNTYYYVQRLFRDASEIEKKIVVGNAVNQLNQLKLLSNYTFNTLFVDKDFITSKIFSFEGTEITQKAFSSDISSTTSDTREFKTQHAECGAANNHRDMVFYIITLLILEGHVFIQPIINIEQINEKPNFLPNNPPDFFPNKQLDLESLERRCSTKYDKPKKCIQEFKYSRSLSLPSIDVIDSSFIYHSNKNFGIISYYENNAVVLKLVSTDDNNIPHFSSNLLPDKAARLVFIAKTVNNNELLVSYSRYSYEDIEYKIAFRTFDIANNKFKNDECEPQAACKLTPSYYRGAYSSDGDSRGYIYAYMSSIQELKVEKYDFSHQSSIYSNTIEIFGAYPMIIKVKVLKDFTLVAYGTPINARIYILKIDSSKTLKECATIKAEFSNFELSVVNDNNAKAYFAIAWQNNYGLKRDEYGLAYFKKFDENCYIKSYQLTSTIQPSCAFAVDYNYIYAGAIPMCYSLQRYGELESIQIIDKKFFMASFSMNNDITTVTYYDNAIWKNTELPPIPILFNPNIQGTDHKANFLNVYFQTDFRNLYEKTKKEEDTECEYANFFIAHEDTNKMSLGSYEMIRYEGNYEE